MRTSVLTAGARSIMVAVLLFAAMGAGATGMPPIPSLPGEGWPSLAEVEPFARSLMTDVSPADLDAHLAQHPEDIPAIFRSLGSALLMGDAALSTSLERYLGTLTRLHATHETDVRAMVSLMLVDPIRFLRSAEFRGRVLRMLPNALDAASSLALRTSCLRELNELVELEFESSETIAVAWGLVPRDSTQRRIAFDDGVRMPDDLSGPIEASIFSLNTGFFTPEEARTFIAAVRKSAPKRRIVVLADDGIRKALKDVALVETFSRPYTPWPRDPFTVGRTGQGGVVLVNRPNLQPNREEDATMVRALVQSGAFDAHWTVAPVPFHNGHVLLTPKEAWISIHTVEIRALELLGLDRVPAETFDTREGIERYLAAVRKAATELEHLFGRPVRFVHPLEPDPALFARLGGGGGFDLDSLVTLLPARDGSLTALVGDLSLGAKYRVPRAYGVTGEVLPAKPLAAFLDLVAASLGSRGLKVQRLPLLLVNADPKPFLITWNNVVLEATGKTRRAEGFASLIDTADELARRTFLKAGYTLELYPPLIRSVVLSGGYRCASNHVRP